MAKKRVLVWETLAIISGGQKMTLTIMDMLKDHYEFHCLVPAEGMLTEELKKRGITYTIIGDQTLPTGMKGKQVIFRYGWMSLKIIRRSLGQIKKFKPDILYAPGPAALPWSAVCGALVHKPVIWHLHHIFLDGTTKKLLNVCSQWKAVRLIIAVSNCVAKQIVNDKAHGKVEVLYNPVDVEKYSNGNPQKVFNEIKNYLSFDMEKKPIIIGQVALIQRSKRQDFVISVIAKLRKSGYNAVGLFVGECREPNYLDELKKKALSEHLDKYIMFMSRRDDIPDVLKAIDVLMIPSSFEGFPLAGLEAAAAGVPVAACAIGGAMELVEISKAGIRYHNDDFKDAAEKVILCVKHKVELTEAGIGFAKLCSLNMYGQGLVDMFTSVSNS